jgi:hypothetical protein
MYKNSKAHEERIDSVQRKQKRTARYQKEEKIVKGSAIMILDVD